MGAGRDGHSAAMPPAPGIDRTSAELEQHSRVLFTLTMRAMDRMAGDLSASAVRALLALEEYRECKLSELADQLLISPSAASRLVDRLVDNGLVNRQISPDSRREVRLRATPAGRRTARSVIRRRQEAIKEVVASMRAADVAVLAKGLGAFAAAAEATAGSLASVGTETDST